MILKDVAGQTIKPGDVVAYATGVRSASLWLAVVNKIEKKQHSNARGIKWESTHICLTSLDNKKLSNRLLHWDNRAVVVPVSQLSTEQKQNIERIRKMILEQPP